MANFRGWSLHANHFLHKLSFHLHSKHMRKLLSPSPFSRRGNEGMKPLPNTGTCIWIKSDLTPECMLGTTHSTAYVPRAFQTALLVFTITSPDSTSPILSKKLRPRELNCLAKGSLVAQTVKCLPAMRETWVWSLGLSLLLPCKEVRRRNSLIHSPFGCFSVSRPWGYKMVPFPPGAWSLGRGVLESVSKQETLEY